MSHWALPLIGQPWTPEHNCWWLVRKVFGEQLGIDLPLVAIGESPESFQSIREATQASGWKPCEVTDPKEFDVVLMQGPFGRHVGVMINANGFIGLLHNVEDVGVTFQKLSEVRTIGYRNFEFWRHAQP